MKYLLKNWNLKLTALVLAIAVWGHVRGEVNPVETAMFSVRLDYEAPDKFMVLNQNEIPRMVRVTVRAPRVTLREMKGGVPPNPLAPIDEAPPLGPRYATAGLDFSLARVGKQEVVVKVNLTPEDAEVIGSKPGAIEVQLDEAATRSFQVKVVLEDSIPDGYYLDRISSQPADAQAVGPAGRLNKVAAVRALVSGSTFQEDVLSSQNARLVAVDKDGAFLNDIRMIPSTVRVSARLRQKLGAARVTVEPRIVGETPPGVTFQDVRVEPRRISVEGPAARLRDLKTIPLEVDVSGHQKSFQLQLPVKLPEGISSRGEKEGRVTAFVTLSGGDGQGAQPTPEESPVRALPLPPGG